jgi:DNA-binding Lrp family transcriptional regulator
MVSSIVLMKIEKNKVGEVAEKLTDIQGVSEVFSVAGRCDLVCMVRVADNEQLAEAVTERVLKVEGVLETETMIAFRVFSKHDLEGMFSVGLN